MILTNDTHAIIKSVKSREILFVKSVSSSLGILYHQEILIKNVPMEPHALSLRTSTTLLLFIADVSR